MSTPTPGPYPIVSVDLIAPDKIVTRLNHRGNWDAMEEFARLIAQATAMREVLTDLMRWVNSHPRKATIAQSLKERAHDVLAQIEGKS